MGVEQLYFLVGFLVGVLLMGSITVALFILYHEWTRKTDDDDSLFD
jgi:hypothetical protein